MNELIVVACHGQGWIGQCRASLAEHAPDHDVLFADTGTTWPTGAYLRAYYETQADVFLFIQDSMTALADPLSWFRDQWRGSGAVAWQLFPLAFDSAKQERLVTSRYTSKPAHGIVGPVFYTDRASLDRLRDLDLLPPVPGSRMESCASERAWAFAFAQAGMPVVGPLWDHPAHTTVGVGPFRKTWAGRP